jgi:hypothetical protein
MVTYFVLRQSWGKMVNWSEIPKFVGRFRFILASEQLKKKFVSLIYKLQS